MPNRTQIFTVKDVPREYADLFNLLVYANRWNDKDKTKAEIFAEMVTCYAKDQLGEKQTDNHIEQLRKRNDLFYGKLDRS